MRWYRALWSFKAMKQSLSWMIACIRWIIVPKMRWKLWWLWLIQSSSSHHLMEHECLDQTVYDITLWNTRFLENKRLLWRSAEIARWSIEQGWTAWWAAQPLGSRHLDAYHVLEPTSNLSRSISGYPNKHQERHSWTPKLVSFERSISSHLQSMRDHSFTSSCYG